MSEQMQAAQQAMTNWLAGEHELGKAPVKIKCAGEFDLHEMHYYIFKYKKSLFGKWLIGVCGGYKGNEKENCGHIYSEMEEYFPANAQIKAISMVEKVRTYSINLAEDFDDMDTQEVPVIEDGTVGSFVSFVLLDSCEWSLEQAQKHLEKDWYIEITDTEKTEVEETTEPPLADSLKKSKQSILWKVGETTISASLMPAPIPSGEAEVFAANNYLWSEAAEVTQKHTSHIIIAVLGHGQPAIDIGQLFVKVCVSFLHQENAIGIYTSGTVFKPDFYIHVANMMRKGTLPLFNWIFFGLYQADGNLNAYTYGLSAFGKDEMEIIGSDKDPQELRDLLFDIAYYVISENTSLKDGQKIGFAENQKLKIARSTGVALDSDTVKIMIL